MTTRSFYPATLQGEARAMRRARVLSEELARPVFVAFRNVGTPAGEPTATEWRTFRRWPTRVDRTPGRSAWALWSKVWNRAAFRGQFSAPGP